jgi:tetratricopeptide (TPR) repeat protein
MRSRLLGEDHVDNGKSWNNLAITLDMLGRHDEAEKALRRSIAIKEKVLGKEHPVVGSSWATLGMVLVMLGRYEEAAAAIQHALEIEIPKLTEQHPSVANSYSELGLLYTVWGHWEDARVWGEKALAVKEKVMADRPQTLDAALELAWTHLRLGHVDAAAALIEHVRPKIEEAKEDARIGAMLALRAEVRARSGAARDAEVDAHRALELAAAERNPLVSAEIRARAALIVKDRAAARAAREVLATEPHRYLSMLAMIDAAFP